MLTAAARARDRNGGIFGMRWLRREVEYTGEVGIPRPVGSAYLPCMNAAGIPLRDRLRDPSTDFGFVASPRIGDSLVSMVVVENLRRAGRSITVWGDHLHAIRRWFPEADIRPVPQPAARAEAWRSHDLLLHFRPLDVREGTRSFHDGVVVLDDAGRVEYRAPPQAANSLRK